MAAFLERQLLVAAISWAENLIVGSLCGDYIWAAIIWAAVIWAAAIMQWRLFFCGTSLYDCGGHYIVVAAIL